MDWQSLVIITASILWVGYEVGHLRSVVARWKEDWKKSIGIDNEANLLDDDL
ncbi:MAG: hypothetical protein ABIG99_01185 [Patescibacteria group bacterium]